MGWNRTTAWRFSVSRSTDWATKPFKNACLSRLSELSSLRLYTFITVRPRPYRYYLIPWCQCVKRCTSQVPWPFNTFARFICVCGLFRGEGSNLYLWLMRPSCYHYTTPQYFKELIRALTFKMPPVDTGGLPFNLMKKNPYLKTF